MKVENRLTPIVPGVGDETVAAFGHTLLRGELLRYQHEVAHQFGVGLFQVIDRSDVPVGHDQDMRGSDGMNVAEGCYTLIAVQDGAWRFSGDDFAEDTGHGCESLGVSREWAAL